MPYQELHGCSMGTTWSIKFAPPAGAPSLGLLQAAIEKTLADITAQMSTWKADSVISRLNQAEPGWYQLPEAMFHVLQQALALARQTSGAYDPTLGALVDLWGFGPGGVVSAPPDDNAITAALAQSGWKQTALNEEHRGVWQPGHLRFDLSSIAKGYGADQIGAVLNAHHITDYLVELGGELLARGVNPQHSAWAVAIEIPDRSDTLPITLPDCAIATSGDYRRYFHHNGQRYGHTLDPRTGQPLLHQLASVSVLHTSCLQADALATALLCLGPESGPAYARQHHIPALFIHRHPDDTAFEWTSEFLALAQR